MTDEKMIDVGECCSCKTRMMVPEPLYKSARHSPDIWFHCAYGHRQHYSKTPAESEADKLRRERDRLNQRLAQKDDEIIRQRDLREAAERRESAQKGQVTRLKNRASAGVCPCCNRTFQNLASHMKGKHPDFNKEKPGLKVVEGGKK